jgi:hypothetical protein
VRTGKVYNFFSEWHGQDLFKFSQFCFGSVPDFTRRFGSSFDFWRRHLRRVKAGIDAGRHAAPLPSEEL